MPDTLCLVERSISIVAPVSDVEGDTSVLVWLNGVALWIQNEDLSFLVVPGSDDYIVTSLGKNSARLHQGDESEWFVWNQSILSIILVSIDKVPSLVQTIRFLPDNNILSILINISFNCHNDSSDVLDSVTSDSELLVPSAVLFQSNEISVLTFLCNVEHQVFVCHCVDCLEDWIPIE